MSTAKHKSFRKVLLIYNFTTDGYNGKLINCKRVIWCTLEDQTSRTVKTTHIGITTYVGSYKFRGISALFSRKPVSINIKDPLNSKFFSDLNMKREYQESLQDAYRDFVLGSSERCKNQTGVVSWFSGTEGFIRHEASGHLFAVYACNIQGAKTWYPETACMFLKEGETVTFDLADMGDHLTSSKVRGNVYFDAEKWNSLDQSKLAFKCNEEGQAINGLFADGAK